MSAESRAPEARADVTALAAKLRKPVTRACPSAAPVEPDDVLGVVVDRVLAARAARAPGDPIAGSEQWRIAWLATVEVLDDVLLPPGERSAIPSTDQLWAAARRELRRTEIDRLDKRASRDPALRQRLTIARNFAEQAALDEEETVNAEQVLFVGDLPEELEELDASHDRRGLLRVAAVLALLAALLLVVFLASR